MSTFRVNKNKNFTVMSNYHLRDKNLSLKAKGLLSVMLSLPETWDYSIAGLVAICQEGEGAVKTALKELKENRYLIITKINPNKTKSGRIEYIYDIYEEPATKQKQEGSFQPLEIQSLEKQEVENSGQLNTDIKNIEKSNTDISSIDIKDTMRQFVNEYPKPVNEYELYRLWVGLNMTDELFETIMQGLKEWKQSEQWQKNNGQYIMNALRWVRERQWEFKPPKAEVKVSQKSVNSIDHRKSNYDTDAYRKKAQDPSNYVYKKKS